MKKISAIIAIMFCLALPLFAFAGCWQDKYETAKPSLAEADGWKLTYSDDFSGTVSSCDEGTLEWVDKEKLYSLPIWEGDKIFLRLIEEKAPFFSLKLEYSGDTLINAVLNGKRL